MSKTTPQNTTEQGHTKDKKKLMDTVSSSTDSSTERRKERRYKSTAPKTLHKKLASRSPSEKKSVHGAPTVETEHQPHHSRKDCGMEVNNVNSAAIKNKLDKMIEKSTVVRKIKNEKKLKTTLYCEFGIDKLLQERGLWDNLMNVGAYNLTVIRKFYDSVILDIGDPQSRKFGQIHLRGKIYHFTTEVINVLYGLPMNKITDWDMDGFVERKLIAELTGGKVKKWQTSPFQSTKLTCKYAVLHKMTVASWMPTRNSTIITKDHAIFIYCLGVGLPLNFGQMVFNAVLKNELDDEHPSYFPV